MRWRGEKDEDGKQQGTFGKKLKKTSNCQRNWGGHAEQERRLNETFIEK